MEIYKTNMEPSNIYSSKIGFRRRGECEDLFGKSRANLKVEELEERIAP